MEEASVLKRRSELKKTENKNLLYSIFYSGRHSLYILLRTTVLPYGKFIKRWEFSRCIFAFFSAILFPCLPYFQLEYRFLYFVGIALDISAWIDMYFRFHVCYYNDQNLLVSHPLWTLSHYIKGNFVLDFLFAFPFDRIMYRPVYDINGETYVTYHSIDFLRMLRVGQVYRIHSTLSTAGIDFLSPPHLFWVIVTTTMLTTVFLNVSTSILVLMCVYYKKNKEGDYHIEFEQTARKYFEHYLATFNFPPSPSHVFILNFYWTCCIAFGLGFGDISATTRELAIYVVLVILVSYLYFNYVTVIIASYLTSSNMNLTIFQKRMSHLIGYLKAENVEINLRRHIINHFEYVWKKNKGMNAQIVFENFNNSLRNDVTFHLYEETIKGVPAFEKLSASFHRLLCSKLDEIYFQTGAAIYKPGDIISHFFIVHQGEVTIVGKNENETTELRRSMIFGIFKNIPQGTVALSAVATKNVTILGIEATSLFQILKQLNTGSSKDSQEEQYRQFEIALAHSNGLLLDSNEGTQGATPSKSHNQVVSFIYRYQRHILVLYVILSLYSANLASLNLAFRYNNFIFLIITMSAELLFFLKIFIELFKGYLDEFGEFVSDLRKIRKRYVKTIGFYVDVIGAIPFEILAVLYPGDNSSIVNYLRMTKLLRLYNVWYFFNSKFDTLNVNMVLLKIISGTVWTATLLHQCSCVWFLISCPNAKDCSSELSWRPTHPTADMNNYYLNCWYFIVTVMTTTGWGDITPHTVSEILCVIIFCYISFFFTAIFIGEMVSTTQKHFFSKAIYKYQLEGLNTYLTVSDVPLETQKIVLKYLANLWRNEKGRQIPELLARAPRYLIYEIKLSTYGRHINENPVFKKCSSNFRKQLVSLLNRIIFYHGDIIVYEGEVNRTAYFVHLGQVVCEDCYGKERKVFLENTCFGLPQFVNKNMPHITTYYANSSCIILALNIKKAKYLRRFFPEDMSILTKEINEMDEEN